MYVIQSSYTGIVKIGRFVTISIILDLLEVNGFYEMARRDVGRTCGPPMYHQLSMQQNSLQKHGFIFNGQDGLDLDFPPPMFVCSIFTRLISILIFLISASCLLKSCWRWHIGNIIIAISCHHCCHQLPAFLNIMIFDISCVFQEDEIVLTVIHWCRTGASRIIIRVVSRAIRAIVVVIIVAVVG